MTVHILAVGATGVTGRYLVPLLLGRGHRVTVLSTGRRLAALPARVGAIQASLLDVDVEQRLTEVLAGCDAVVNTATAMPRNVTAPGAWEAMARVRIEGTRRMVRAARASQVSRLVQMSITMAYPDGGEAWLDESTPFDPTPARAALVEPVVGMESAVRELADSPTAWTILRGARFIGPGTVQDAQRAHLHDGTLAVPGDGRSFVSMVHVADFAAALVAALERGFTGQVLNISGEPVRIGEYFERLASAEGCPPPRKAPEQRPDLPSQRVDSSAARRMLDWAPLRELWSTSD